MSKVESWVESLTKKFGLEQGFSNRPVGRFVGQSISNELKSQDWRKGDSLLHSRGCFRGNSATAVDWLPVGRHLVHFKNILSVRGGDKGGPIFLFNFLGFQLNLSWFFFSNFFLLNFFKSQNFAYRRTLLGILSCGRTAIDWIVGLLAPAVDPPAGCEKPCVSATPIIH